MATITGNRSIVLRLQQRGRAVGNVRTDIRVGYRAPYAVFVHENQEVHHPVGKAKFLTDPARRLRGELREIIRGAVRRGRTLEQALLIAGNRLLRESQAECPVDTGFLRASAYVSVNSGGG